MIRVRDLIEHGIHPEYLRRLCEKGLLIKMGRGIYIPADTEISQNVGLAEQHTSLLALRQSRTGAGNHRHYHHHPVAVYGRWAPLNEQLHPGAAKSGVFYWTGFFRSGLLPAYPAEFYFISPYR